MAAPFGIEVQDLGDRLLITRRWIHWAAVPMGLVALAWIGLTLCRNADRLFNVCNFLFLRLGLLVLYMAVVTVTNRTEIDVDAQEMKIWHGPVPSLTKSKTVPVQTIDHLTLKKIKFSGNLAAGGRSWALHMVDRFGETSDLIGDMDDWNQAEYIRQEIERFLSRLRSQESAAATPPQRAGSQAAEPKRPDVEALLAALDEPEISGEEEGR